jgi:hypothetical protein
MTNTPDPDAPETQAYTVKQGAKGILVNGKMAGPGESVDLTLEEAVAFADRLEPLEGADEPPEEDEADKVAPQATSKVPQDIGGQTRLQNYKPVNLYNDMPLSPDMKPLPPAAPGRATNLSHDFAAIAKAEEEGTGPSAGE